MSAVISDKVMMKEVLKATGFDCPQGMENKTFEEATSGGGSGGEGGSEEGGSGDITIVSAQVNVLNTPGKPVKLAATYDKSLDDNYVVWFKKEQVQIPTRDFEVGRTYKYTTQNTAGITFDITFKKEVTGVNYRIMVEFKDRGTTSPGLACFLILGASN